MTTTTEKTFRHLTTVGLSLAATILVAWATIHIYGVHVFQFDSWQAFLIAPLMVLVQMWLSVGLFIIAHDAIHGSLAPSFPRLNPIIGHIATTLYAGFDYRKLEVAHHQHHRTPGTAEDPDFSADHPTQPVQWFIEFFTRYFSWRPLIFVHTVVGISWLLLGADMLNLVLFYGLPALASAAQLFYFGTYLPHRHNAEAGPFPDHHNARTNSYPVWLSLFTCFHFGYHHEHHLYPHEPWWRLPARFKAAKQQRSAEISAAASIG